MNTPIKITAYAGVLAAAFAGALGIGSLTGSPVDRSDAQATEEAATHRTVVDEPDADPPAGAHTPAGLQVSEAGYTLSAITAPRSAREQGTLSFSITGPDGAPVIDFTELHEQELHLIAVRTDTSGYRHVHPTLGNDGVWSIDWEWASGGTYKVFADVEPTALGEGLTLARTVEVGGAFAPESLPAESNVAEVDGYTVTLTGELLAGQSAQVTASIERDGEPVTDLEPYLGAYGHLVALRTGDLAYLHVHPEGEPGDGVTAAGPDVRFIVETPTTGTYRLFLDFQVDGQVRTAEFTLTTADVAGARDADPDDPADDTSHGGGDADHGH